MKTLAALVSEKALTASASSYINVTYSMALSWPVQVQVPSVTAPVD
jgi:hypothetical protein